MIILIFLIGTLIPTRQQDNNFVASLIYKKYPNRKETSKLTIPFRVPNKEEYTPATHYYTEVLESKYNIPSYIKNTPEAYITEDTDTASSSKEYLNQIDKEMPSASENAKHNTDANRYHLIIASLTSEAQAKEYIAQQTYYKMDELTILECNDKYRVSAKSFHTYKEALHHLDSIKSTTDKSVWILCK